ncbi:hypothetical protein EWF20_13970 [Sulfolobus sp. S-194]|uniref:hypothetical protein n=1 Tax=Sulfolobus sp. S-194 TaxID=2512240 RepID=UPI00143722AA|nr:hypothetical protein [Sulfolobus sp. S-194]QIW25135.1 hypothetical protein EWF20_13970 [Sulfolobus sp. S-194]
MKIPDYVKSQLKEGTCIVCCDEYVVCMSEDLPKRTDVNIDFEIDREEGEVVLRNIIYDDPSNPLYLEYFVSKKFVQSISEKGEIEVYFVDANFNQKMKMNIKIDKDDIRLLKRELGIGS